MVVYIVIGYSKHSGGGILLCARHQGREKPRRSNLDKARIKEVLAAILRRDLTEMGLLSEHIISRHIVSGNHTNPLTTVGWLTTVATKFGAVEEMNHPSSC